MIIVGDVHGNFRTYRHNLMTDKDISVQLGDFGLGFVGHKDPKYIPENWYFIRGNHDNPEVCKKYPNYLGDFGYKKLSDHLYGLDFFFVSGAWSIDQHLRTIGVDWWKNEELSIPQGQECLNLWEELKPDICLSHDGPDVATDKYKFGQKIPTRTGQLLQQMFEIYKPKVWCFGHYHIDDHFTIDGTEFHVLDELSTVHL
jgi:predicted phosphodiesterase